MKKSDKFVVGLLIFVLIVVVGIGGYYFYYLNNKIDEQDKTISNLKSQNSKSQNLIENLINNSNTNTTNETINTENLNQSNSITTEKTTKDTIKDLFLNKLKQASSKNSSDKLLDYRVDKVEITSFSEQEKVQLGYEPTDILAYVTYSVKPENISTSTWMSGNGEKSGEWIVNKVSCECLKNGKLIPTDAFSTSF